MKVCIYGAGAIGGWIGAKLALAGCADLPASRGDATQDPRWQARSAQLARLRDWQLDARIGVNRDRQAWSASLKWQQHGPRYEIDLLGPFGLSGLRPARSPPSTATPTRESSRALKRRGAGTECGCIARTFRRATAKAR